MLAIQSGLRTRPFAGKRQLTFGTPLTFPVLQPLGADLILTGHLGHTLARVQLAHASHFQFAGIFLSGHQHRSPLFTVAGPLISCLSFWVHSSYTPSWPRCPPPILPPPPFLRRASCRTGTRNRIAARHPR